MLKIDDNLLLEIGLGSLPTEEKRGLLSHIYETLEMRVGMRLADQMTNEQLDEFEQYFEAKDDAGAFKWLETNFPNYKEIVNEEFEKLKTEVAQTAPNILAAAQSRAPQGVGDSGQQAPALQNPSDGQYAAPQPGQQAPQPPQDQPMQPQQPWQPSPPMPQPDPQQWQQPPAQPQPQQQPPVMPQQPAQQDWQQQPRPEPQSQPQAPQQPWQPSPPIQPQYPQPQQPQDPGQWRQPPTQPPYPPQQ